jgi:hypothetical protein
MKTSLTHNPWLTVANASSEIGINLLRANKEAVEGLNKPARDVPAGLSHFYGES